MASTQVRYIRGQNMNMKMFSIDRGLVVVQRFGKYELTIIILNYFIGTYLIMSNT